jgi:hypothetical protein
MSSGEARPPSYRWRIVLFLTAAIAVLLLFNTLYRGLNTLAVLDHIEAERDQWQRPSEVIPAPVTSPSSWEPWLAPKERSSPWTSAASR